MATRNRIRPRLDRVGQCRRYVGFERREEQCEAAARRLSQGVLDFGEGRL